MRRYKDAGLSHYVDLDAVIAVVPNDKDSGKTLVILNSEKGQPLMVIVPLPVRMVLENLALVEWGT